MRLSKPGSFLKGRAVGGLFKLSAGIDRTLEILTRIGMWCGLALVVVVCYDVLSRYFGVPKPFGLNSTMVQESEYWLHTFLFALVIGYTYTRQGHVRIDLIRDKLPVEGKICHRDVRLCVLPDFIFCCGGGLLLQLCAGLVL